MATSRSSSSSDEEYEKEEEKQPTNQNPNTNSIDTSLDAIETQLSSISFIPPPIEDHHPTDQPPPPPPSAADHNEEKSVDGPDGLIAETGAEKERILSGESGRSSGTDLWGDGKQVEGGYGDFNEEKSVFEVNDGMVRETRETGGEKRRNLVAESSSLDYNEEMYVSEINDGTVRETGGEKPRNNDYDDEEAVSENNDGAVMETGGEREKRMNLVSESSSLDLGRNDKQVVADYDDEEAVAGINNGAVRETDGEKQRDLIGESSSLDMWRNNNVEVEVEVEGGLSSPTSSGYAGERGSSSGGSVTSGSGTDGIREVVREDNGSSVGDGGVVRLDSSEAQWSRGKRHADEDDTSISWRKRKKHFFVLSHSGKPIYSRYGDEHKLAGFSATLQAIISFVEDGGDRVKLVRAGKHQVVFLVKGPIYLVCISCTEEPHESLRGQLELLYGQMILILTRSVDRCFEKNSKFDMTPLLGGTDAIFSSLIHSFGQNPATFLHAYTCLPLAYATRQAAGAILQDVADTGVVFAILMCKDKVVSLVGLQKSSLHPDDMLLLANFVTSSESFRTSESFSPICLPRYNAMAFLYAYVHYFDADTYLILLTASSQAFFHLKECRIQIENVLSKSNVLNEVQKSISDGGLRVDQLPVDPSARSGSLFHSNQRRPPETVVGVGGPAGLLHFIYRSIYLDQYVSSEFAPPISSPPQQKRLYRAYQRLYASMHDKGIGPHKTQFRRDENYVLLCWVTQDFELYAAFDPLADKAVAIRICNRVCQWVKDVENEIFLLGASPFSW